MLQEPGTQPSYSVVEIDSRRPIQFLLGKSDIQHVTIPMGADLLSLGMFAYFEG